MEMRCNTADKHKTGTGSAFEYDIGFYNPAAIVNFQIELMIKSN